MEMNHPPRRAVSERGCLSPHIFPLLVGALLTILLGCAAPAQQTDYLLLVIDDSTGESGYRDAQGKMAIPLGKYTVCVTDTFRTFAFVLIEHRGFVAIDREKRVLYDVYAVDNGPDFPSEGLFRIVRDGLIGYADSATGAVVIEARYPCAFSFEEGKAQVATDCRSEKSGEYTLWKSDSWFFIDRRGKVVPAEGRDLR
jgi:hypothetical protein